VKAFYGLLSIDIFLIDEYDRPLLFFRFHKCGMIRWDYCGADLIGQVVANGIRDHEISVGQSLHQRRSAQPVGTMIAEIGFLPGNTTPV